MNSNHFSPRAPMPQLHQMRSVPLLKTAFESNLKLLREEYNKRHDNPAPPGNQQHGYSKNAGRPRVTADDRRWQLPTISGRDNKIIIYNGPVYTGVVNPGDEPPYHQDGGIDNSGGVKNDVESRRHSSSTTIYRSTRDPDKTVPSFEVPPKQQKQEHHVKEPLMVDDEGPRAWVTTRRTYLKDSLMVDDKDPHDEARRRRAYRKHMSGKPTPAADKMQPHKRSTAVSAGCHGGVMSAVLRSKLCYSESESEDSD